MEVDGHTLRKPDGDVTNFANEWNPQGSRRLGCPGSICRRQIEKKLPQKQMLE